MKKTKQLILSEIILFLLLSFLLFFAYINKFSLEFRRIWYIFVMAIIGANLFIKYLIFHNENMLWFAIVISLSAVYIYLINKNILVGRALALSTLIPLTASFVVMLLYGHRLYKCLTILCCFTCLPVLCIGYEMFLFWWGFAIEGVAILGGVETIKKLYKKGD